MMRHDFVRQKDSMQCGVAALSMVCRHFGADYTPEFVSDYCHATNQGVSMKGLSDAASQLGLKSEAGRLTTEQLMRCPLPSIVLWNQNHFVVLNKISSNGKKFL